MTEHWELGHLSVKLDIVPKPAKQKNASKCISDDRPYIIQTIYATVDHISVPVSHRRQTLNVRRIVQININ